MDHCTNCGIKIYSPSYMLITRCNLMFFCSYNCEKKTYHNFNENGGKIYHG